MIVYILYRRVTRNNLDDRYHISYYKVHEYTTTFSIYLNKYQHFGITIQEQYDVQRQVELGHACMTVKLALFDADDRMVAFTDPVWLQLAFDKLMGIFEWGGGT